MDTAASFISYLYKIHTGACSAASFATGSASPGSAVGSTHATFASTSTTFFAPVVGATIYASGSLNGEERSGYGSHKSEPGSRSRS